MPRVRYASKAGGRFDRSLLCPYTHLYENEGNSSSFSHLWGDAGVAERRRLEIGWRESARGFKSLSPRGRTTGCFIRGGAGEAERARLLSEYTRKCIEGSNPSLPAQRKSPASWQGFLYCQTTPNPYNSIHHLDISTLTSIPISL